MGGHVKSAWCFRVTWICPRTAFLEYVRFSAKFAKDFLGDFFQISPDESGELFALVRCPEVDP